LPTCSSKRFARSWTGTTGLAARRRPFRAFRQHFQRKLTITIPATEQQLSLFAPTVAKALQQTAKLGMVRETTGKQRHRLFTYHLYLDILNEGTELSKASR
jgi:hypothetical protein